MRKLKFAALLVVCAVLLGGCQWFSWLFPPSPTDVYDPTKYQTEFSNRWQYQSLSPDEQTYYGCLYTAVMDTQSTDTQITYTEDGETQHKPGVRVSLPDATFSNESITRIYESFFTDNPQFFFLDRTYSMEGVQEISGETYYNTLILQYTHTTEQRIQATQQLQAATDAIFAQIPDTESQYEMERYLHDRLNALCTYDVEAAESDVSTTPYAYTAYGALVGGKAVCEGYAKAMQLLLHRASIPVTLVTGTAKDGGESHMWNLVTIDGENYYLDATWNDTGDRLQYTFFNLTTEMVLASCDIDNAEALPLCTATKHNPFVLNNTIIDTYERQVIAQKIAARIIAGDTTIQLRFTEGKLDNGILFLRNKKLMTSMVNQHLSDTNLTMWDYDLWSDSSQRVLTLVRKS